MICHKATKRFFEKTMSPILVIAISGHKTLQIF